MRHCKDSEDDRDDRQDKQGDLHRTIGPFALHLPVAGVDVIRPRGNVSPFDRGSLGIALDRAWREPQAGDPLAEHVAGFILPDLEGQQPGGSYPAIWALRFERCNKGI